MMKEILVKVKIVSDFPDKTTNAEIESAVKEEITDTFFDDVESIEVEIKEVSNES